MDTRLVEVTIRPPRIATFINAKDPHWQNTVLRIIEIYSEIWGGAYDIIVPYEIKGNNLDILPIFKAILKKYDPDFLGIYKDEQIESLSNEKIQNELMDKYINSFPDNLFGLESVKLSEENSSFEQILSNEENSDLLNLIVYSVLGKFDPYDVKIEDIAKKVFTKKLFFEYFYQFRSSPFNITLTKLSYLPARHFHPLFHPLMIIVGNSLNDFLLYYDLLRLNFGCVFIPINLKNQGQNRSVQSYIRNIFANYFRHNKINLTSLSESQSVMSEIWEEIKKIYKGRIIDGFSKRGDPEKLELKYISVEELKIKISESDSVQIYYSSDQVIGFLKGNELNLNLDRTLKHPLEYLNFIVDLKPKRIKYPPRKLLNQIQIISPNYINYRISHSGISINSEYGGRIGPISIKILNAFDIFSLLLKEGNFSCELSDKGKYFKETLNKFEGINETEKLKNLAEFVRSEKYKLVGMYLVKLGKENVVNWHPQIDIDLQKIRSSGLKIDGDNRIYLKYDDLKKRIWNDEKKSRAFISFCLEKEILKMGFILKCPKCSHKSFYSLNVIKDTFICKRCDAVQKITCESLHDQKPIIYYMLSEVIFQFFEQNGDVSLLTLNWLKKHKSKEAFMFSPEVKIYKNNQEYLELDIACICDGKIIIGECKKTNEDWNKFLEKQKNEKKSKKDRFLEILQIIQPDIVVFSTLDKQKPDKANNNLANFIKEIQRQYHAIEFVNLNKENLLANS